MHIPGLLRTPCQLLAAGLSKGGLYWHFKSKDKILAAMLMQLFDQEMAVLSRFVDTSGSVASKLRQLVRQAIDAVLESVALTLHAQLGAGSGMVARPTDGRAPHTGRFGRRVAPPGVDGTGVRFWPPRVLYRQYLTSLSGYGLHAATTQTWSPGRSQVSLPPQPSFAHHAALRGPANSLNNAGTDHGSHPPHPVTATICARNVVNNT
jgi:AcrR family transcriptional regulator